MTIAYRASSEGHTGSSGSLTLALPVPTGTVAGDLMVAVVARDTSAGYPATPSGWTLLSHGLSTYAELSVYYRVAGSSEPSSYTWSASSSVRMAGAVVSWSGVDTANPIAANSISPASASASSVTAPSVTLSGGTTVMAVFDADWQYASLSTPGGLTVRQQTQPGGVSSNTAPLLVVADFVRAASGATGDLVATDTGSRSGYWMGAQIALRANNTAPNAPTLNNPANATTIDRGATQRFTITPSDPDAGDTMSKFDIQYRTPTGTGTWVQVTDSTGNAYHDFAANTFSAATYEWQARTYDSSGVVGPWSPSDTFTAADQPVDPTITDPINGQTITGPNYVAHYTDGGTYTDSQWRTVADNAGSPDGTTVYWSSGSQGTATSVTVPFATDGRYEHLQVRVYNGAWWSSWADVRVDVNYLKQGNSSGSYGFSGSASGVKPTRGSATGGYAYALPSASGTKPSKGSATLAYGFVATATATSTPAGSASGMLSLAISGTGHAPPNRGQATAALAFAVSATGAKPPGRGSATIRMSFASSATGAIVQLLFTPPTILESADDHFWGRYSVPVGQSVVKTGGVYKTTPYPWLGDIKHLKEGVDYFLGGRTYEVSNDVAAALTSDGYSVAHS